jgi:hypothetical protein
MGSNKSMKKSFLLLPAIVLLAAGCNSGQQSSQKDLIQNQSLCNNFGETIRKNLTVSNPNIVTHYNIAMKKCFVEETAIADYGKVGDFQYGSAGFTEDDIFDGEKGIILISLITHFSTSNNPIPDIITDNRNGDYNNLTLQQFTTLKDQYMNN